jgi:hypothetical protein
VSWQNNRRCALTSFLLRSQRQHEREKRRVDSTCCICRKDAGGWGEIRPTPPSPYINHNTHGPLAALALALRQSTDQIRSDLYCPVLTSCAKRVCLSPGRILASRPVSHCIAAPLCSLVSSLPFGLVLRTRRRNVVDDGTNARPRHDPSYLAFLI